MFSYDQACEYIQRSASLGSRPGLGRIKRLCEILGNPEADLRFIHVAGTNGKGSTCAMIASALTAAHVRVGMYYSPAITCIEDHYMICGKLITHEDYAKAVSAVASANEQMIRQSGESATQFELETAVAFYHFRENHCDVVLLECGMGGRDDATNIVPDKICCVITSVSRDHMEYLGDTPGKIASVKAGIITSDAPVVVAKNDAEVIDAIKERCDITGSPMYIAGSSDDTAAVDKMKTALRGTFQKENAAAAYRVLKVIDEKKLLPDVRVDDAVIAEGFADTRWPFRFEQINDDPVIILDGAHNPDAAVKLRETIESELDGYKIVFVMGVFADKEYEKEVATLADKAYMIITVQTPGNKRALPAEKLAECAGRYCERTETFETIKEAYERAVSAANDIDGDAAIIACGSLSYLKEFRDCAI